MRGLAISDKVVLIEPVQAIECFTPVPEVGKVYCVRDVVGKGRDHSIRLVGVRGRYEAGSECWLYADKFRPLKEVKRRGAK